MARPRKLNRKPAVRTPAAKVVIVTEGIVTEPQYLRSFNRIHTSNSIRPTIRRIGGDPRTVVDKAVEEKKSLKGDTLAAQDTVWAMFDRDEHPRFAEAVDMARANHIQLATSNPCFEIWGIFHYQDFNAPVHRHDCQQNLASLCPGYGSKSGAKVFDDPAAIENGYEDAVVRAKNSLRRREDEGDSEGNPSTQVHLLTEHILKLFAS